MLDYRHEGREVFAEEKTRSERKIGDESRSSGIGAPSSGMARLLGNWTICIFICDQSSGLGLSCDRPIVAISEIPSMAIVNLKSFISLLILIAT